jgi:hypothetical protein
MRTAFESGTSDHWRGAIMRAVVSLSSGVTLEAIVHKCSSLPTVLTHLQLKEH